MALTLTNGALTLRPFEPEDIQNFRALHADPDVMRDLGGPISADEAATKLTRYIASFNAHGHGRFAVFEGDVFAGYVGVMRLEDPAHPLGIHCEIGWRLLPAVWGKGIATRAAAMALSDVFDRVGLDHVLAYTLADNLRSQSVMTRLGMTRRPDLDYEEHYPPIGAYRGLVWRITASDWAATHQRSGGME